VELIKNMRRKTGRKEKEGDLNKNRERGGGGGGGREDEKENQLKGKGRICRQDMGEIFGLLIEEEERANGKKIKWKEEYVNINRWRFFTYK
jgi:hypothetical protein